MEFFTTNLPYAGEWTTYFERAFLRNFLSLKQLSRNGFLENRPLRSDAANAPLGYA
jgi:hypothetical protein